MIRRLLLSALLLAAPAASAQSAVAASGGLVTVVGNPRPLNTFLQALGAMSGRSVMVLPGVPDVQVNYQFDRTPFDAAWLAVVSAHGLVSCRTPQLLLVGGPESARVTCAALGAELLAGAGLGVSSGAGVSADSGTDAAGTGFVNARYPLAALPEPGHASTPDAGALVAGPGRRAVRVRLLEVADNSSGSVGVDWSSGLLSTVVGLGVSAASGLASGAGLPTFDPGQFSKTVSALESRGLARKLDDVRLNLVDGRPTVFRSGGTLQLSLLGGGDQKIERTIQYGLTLNLTPSTAPDGSLSVAVVADLASPVSVSNPALLDLTTRSITSDVALPAGAGVVVAAFSSVRDESGSSGLPGSSSAPVALRALAGTSTSSAARTTVIVTLEEVTA